MLTILPNRSNIYSVRRDKGFLKSRKVTIMCKCCVCHNEISANSVSVNLANRNSKASKQNTNARLCERCASVVYADNTVYNVVSGVQTSDGLSYQLFIPCVYDAQLRAEFMSAGWLPCVSGFKSPVYNNMKWHKKFITLQKSIASNQYVSAHGKVVDNVRFAIMRDGVNLKSVEIPFKSKDGFLAIVRETVAPYK